MKYFQLINQRNKTKIVQQYHTEFNSTLFALDEGLFFDDTVLAGALWRNFFGKSDVDPVYLELLLSYVRSQVILSKFSSLLYDELIFVLSSFLGWSFESN